MRRPPVKRLAQFPQKGAVGKMEIMLKKERKGAIIPTYGSGSAAGADLYACIDAPVSIGAGETALVPSGVSMAIPEGFAGFVFARSSLGTKRGIAPANKVGVIDSDYRGEIFVALHNHSGTAAVIEPDERIAQLVIMPVVQAGFIETDELPETVRGDGGFGSTGRY